MWRFAGAPRWGRPIGGLSLLALGLLAGVFVGLQSHTPDQACLLQVMGRADAVDCRKLVNNANAAKTDGVTRCTLSRNHYGVPWRQPDDGGQWARTSWHWWPPRCRVGAIVLKPRHWQAVWLWRCSWRLSGAGHQ